MSTSRELGGATTGLGVRTVRVSITDVPASTGSLPSSGQSSDIPPMTNSNSPFASEFKNLSSGANTITVPANAAGVTIIPPNGNAVTWTLKGVSGDTGIALHVLGVLSMPLASSVATFVITTGNTLSGVSFEWW